MGLISGIKNFVRRFYDSKPYLQPESRVPLGERVVDVNQPAIMVGEPEFRDDIREQYGSGLYREVEEVDFERQRELARISLERLRERFGRKK